MYWYMGRNESRGLSGPACPSSGGDRRIKGVFIVCALFPEETLLKKTTSLKGLSALHTRVCVCVCVSPGVI